MRRIIKVFLIILLVVIMTGCSGNYNLKINEDLSLEEELDISIPNDDNAYQKTLNIFENNNINKDKYNVVISDNKVKINYKDKFSSIEDYILNSKVYSQIFSDIQYNKKDNYIELTIDENIKLKNSNNTLNGTNLNDLDLIQINVTNPFKVLSSNAELVNENTYIWSIKNSDISKNIQLKFKSSLNQFPYRAVITLSILLIVIIVFGIILFRRYRKTQKF